jgi:hypothetical protein
MTDIAAKLAAPFDPAIVSWPTYRPDITGDERSELIARFWSHVWITRGDDSRCWVWTGGCHQRPDGRASYGRFTVRGEHIYAHRFIYQMTHGLLPDDLVVRHKCDEEPCVNPRHLIEGTLSDNTRDKFERGRGPNRKGEKHPLARLSDNDVREIRQLRALGRKEATVAEQFGICRAQVYRIVTGRNWGHI